ncbi:MAG TPA: BrxA family protein [Ktedonobacteraceae bacterium]|nr:BrxA family protein [Ktedonobacteraceae bacterium]
MTNTSIEGTQWRITGAYVPTLAGKSSLLEESRLLLEAYTQSGDAQVACKALIDGVLPQRSRETRVAIVRVLRERFFRWHPPVWVLADLAAFAQMTSSPVFPLAALLHIARQDALLYNFVQQVIAPRWNAGTTSVIRADVQSFLDQAQEEQPQLQNWSFATREKVSRNVLTVLRDCTLLKGEVKKQIVLPVVPEPVVQHLIRLLQAEGVAREQIAQHPDWRIWLWDTTQAQKALDKYL